MAILTGTANNDTLTGGTGNDTLQGLEGNDTLYGGSGTDTAVYNGPSSGYQVGFASGSVLSVYDTNTSNGDEGVDTLYGVEQIQFADGTLTVSGGRMRPNANQVTKDTFSITSAADNQADISTVQLAGGGFVVVWAGVENGGGANRQGVFAQRYDANGSVAGDIIHVNTTELGRQNYPVVTALKDGGFVVAWRSEEDNAPDGNSAIYDIYARRYDASGAPTSGEMPVTGVNNDQSTIAGVDERGPSLITLSDGTVVAGWTTNSGPGTGYDIHILRARPDADGELTGVGPNQYDVITVNQASITGDQRSVHVEALNGGKFLVVWSSADDNGNISIHAQTYATTSTSTTASGGELTVAADAGVYNPAVATNDAGNLDAAAHADGSYMIVWQVVHASTGTSDAASDIYAQRYDAQGHTIGAAFQVDVGSSGLQVDPSVAALADGGYIVTYATNQRDGSFDIYVQRYDAAGNPEGSPSRVAGGSSANDLGSPVVTALKDGGYLLSWESYSADGGATGGAVFTQRYAADGTVHLEIKGDAGNNTINLNTGDYDGGPVAITGGAGNDVIRSSGSIDATAVYSGSQADYQISLGAGSGVLTVTDTNPVAGGNDGTDTLVNVNHIKFADGTFDVIGSTIAVAAGNKYQGSPGLALGPGSNSYHETSLATLSNGGFVAAWVAPEQTPQGYAGDPVGAGVYAKIYDATGSELTGITIHVNTTELGEADQQYGPSIAALSDGGFLVVWRDRSGPNSTDPNDVYAQRFDANGNAVGDKLAIGNDPAVDDRNPNMTTLADGSVIVTWAANDGADPTVYNIYAERLSLDNNGDLVADAKFQVNDGSHSSRAPQVVGLADGGYVVYWGGNTNAYAQLYDANGDPVGGNTQVNTDASSGMADSALNSAQISAAAQTQEAGGGYIIVWQKTSNDLDHSSDIMAQRYDASGEKVGGEIQVDTGSTGTQMDPHVAALADGSYVVVYASDQQGLSSGFDIYAAHLSADGALEGNPVRIAGGSSTNNYGSPSIVAADDGGYIVSWYNYSPDGTSGGSVLAQRFDAHDRAILTTVHGNDGNNTINFSGPAQLEGGLGNDTYIVDDAGSVVVEDTNAGTDLVKSSVSYTLAANVENLTLTGSANIDGTGNELANVIAGNSGDNTLDGGVDSVKDTLVGGAGNDTYIVRDTLDVITEAAGGGTDTVESSASYTLAANVENLILTGSADINGTGNALANTITGNSGNNTLDGGVDTVADTLAGGAGDDMYIVRGLNDVVVENADEGTDTVQTAVNGYLLAANVENLVLTGAAAVNGTGNGLANTITGNAAANVLDGGANSNPADHDTLAGGLGNDTYIIHSTDDVITEAANAGTDLAKAEVSYTLAANVENLTLTGSANIDGTGNELANVITGNSGDNTLDGGVDSVKDTLIGGAGNDTYIVRDSLDVITEAAGVGGGVDTVRSTAASYTLAANVENLILAGSDNINGTGNALANTITGNSGNNTLDGGVDTVADTLAGGAGDDTYIVRGLNDVVVENADEGTDTVQTAVNGYLLAANVENLVLTGAAVLNGTGNGLANTITGNAAANVLDGGANSNPADHDTLAGGLGNDTYIIHSTDDVIIEAANAGTDLAKAEVSYTLAANVENLTLTGSANIDGTGNELANVITGNNGDNTLDGGIDQVKDTLVGGAGNDTYIVRDLLDVITEAADPIAGGAHDKAVSYLDSYTLAANVEDLTLADVAGVNSGTGNALDNTITGNHFDNTLYGGAGADILNGEDGNDVLDGGVGADTLVGGTGDDVYVVDNTGDVVTENAGEGLDTVQTALDGYTLGANVEVLILTGTANISGTGNNLANTIGGNTGDNTLDGGLNDNPLDSDILAGWAGNDTYILNNAGDMVFESAGGGTDTVKTALDGYTLADNVENLILTGAGNIGGSGNGLDNVITGNSGQNTLTGGLGADTFVFAAAADSAQAAPDTITDFSAAEGDKIKLYTADASMPFAFRGSDLSASFTGAGDTTHAFEDVPTTAQVTSVWFYTDGTDGWVMVDTDHDNKLGAGDLVVKLSGVTALSEDDFAAGTFGVAVAGKATAQNTGTTGNDDLSAKATDGNDVINGGAGNDILAGLGGNDTLNGDAGNDVLDGGSGSDFLNGGAGADTMIGGTGSDTYVVDNAGDIVTEFAGEGVDTIQSSISNLVPLAANVENLTLTGTANLTGNGNDLDNVILGNAGNNTLNGLDGSDYIDGGAGNDIINGGVGNDELHGGLGNDKITDADGDNLLFGEAGDDILTGGTGADLLDGGIGNDTLDGGLGGDTMVGGLGNDTYFVNDENDVVVEDANGGTDTVKVSAVAGYSLAANVENLILSGATSSGEGNELANVITGSNAAVSYDLSGGDGNDTLNGNALNDTLAGGAGADTLNGGAGDDILDGSSATIGDDGAKDVLVGGAGNDTYYIRGLTDVITEAAGAAGGANDTARVFVDGYVLAANVETLELADDPLVRTATGNAGNNTLIGNIYDNTLNGGAGNDRLDGGDGADMLVGGAGNDTYAFTYQQLVSDNDRIVEAAGAAGGVDTLEVTTSPFDGSSGLSIDLNQYANVENITLLGDSDVGAIGNAGANVLRGDGNFGANVLAGGAGNDIYYVGNGDSVVENAGGGVDTVYSDADDYTLDANVENLTIVAGNVNVNGTGNNLANIITGNEFDNKLTGGGGADTLIGGLGDDTYVVNLIQKGTGATAVAALEDTIVEGVSNDRHDKVQLELPNALTLTKATTLTLGANLEEFDASHTGSTLLNLTGNALNNTLTGNDAANILTGGAGIDAMDGRDGSDTYYVDSADIHSLLTHAVNDSGTGAGDVDTVYFNGIAGDTFDLRVDGVGVENVVLQGALAVNATGNDAANRLTGNAGNNILDGGANADPADFDTLIGGLGNDTYFIHSADDVVTELAAQGNDTLVVTADVTGLGTVDLTQAAYANIENVTLKGDSTRAVIGTSAANVLHAEGDIGANVLTGGAGNDTYYVGNGDSVVESAGTGGGVDIVYSSADDYTLDDNVENLTLAAGAGGISGTGNALANVITGNEGDNTLDGMDGVDKLVGGAGNDTYIVDLVVNGSGSTAVLALQDTIVEAAGSANGMHDKVVLADGDIVGHTSTLSATGLTVTLGANLEDLDAQHVDASVAVNLAGNAAANILIGNDAANIINGGAGNDTLTGGAGADTFFFNTALSGTANVDTITDFTQGEDTIRLENAIFTKLTALGALNAQNFASFDSGSGGSASAAASDASKFVLYDTATGDLFYDADGSGAKAAIKFAVLEGAPALAAGDFQVV